VLAVNGPLLDSVGVTEVAFSRAQPPNENADVRLVQGSWDVRKQGTGTGLE